MIKITEENGVAVDRGQVGDGLVNIVCDEGPKRVIRMGGVVIQSGLQFVVCASGSGSEGLQREQARGGKEPAGEEDVWGNRGAFAVEGDEYFLGNVLGEMSVFDATMGDGINEVDVDGDELSEGFGGLAALPVDEEFMVGH